MNMKIKKTQKSSVDVVEATSKPDARSEAISYIKSAIEVLGDSAKSGDILAKESIANLSVVLFDLK